MNFVETVEDHWRRAGFRGRMSDIKHGDLTRWLSSLEQLPEIELRSVSFKDTVQLCGTVGQEEKKTLQSIIDALIPWRKGPFNLFGIPIDTEWRSDMKWNRIKDHVELDNATVLDVGCGNGYYGWRMIDAGADSVVGLESSVVYVLQAALMSHFVGSINTVVPWRYGETDWEGGYDVVFSMGVLYHQRDADKHLDHLSNNVKAGGTLVLETLVADDVIVPKGRYARMRNVWCIPTEDRVMKLMEEHGFATVQLVDRSRTTTEEQRPTRYMPYESLRQALNPSDPTLTVEGYPAPERAIFVCNR